MPGATAVYALDASRPKKKQSKLKRRSTCVVDQIKKFQRLTREEGEDLFRDFTGENKGDDD